MVGRGGYAAYATAPVNRCSRSRGMAVTEAAGFPVQFLTAHACLFEWGDLEADESVLIQAAAGGVRTAAVQLASNAGAEVFGTASSTEKLELAAELGCDHPINYEETDFREVVDEETGGEGVDLVLESVGGDVFERSLDAMAHFGRMVTYGVASGEPASAENRRLLFENKSVRGFHLGQTAARDPERIVEAVPELTAELTNGDLEVVVGETFALEDAADAHRYLESRKSSGNSCWWCSGRSPGSAHRAQDRRTAGNRSSQTVRIVIRRPRPLRASRPTRGRVRRSRLRRVAHPSNANSPTTVRPSRTPGSQSRSSSHIRS